MLGVGRAVYLHGNFFSRASVSSGASLSMSAGVPSAIVPYRTFGFRTQELIAHEKSKKPITWQNIHFTLESPNIESEELCDHGWISYVPPKTARKKPKPICVPLTKYARKGLDAMTALKQEGEKPIFDNPRNSERFIQA